MSPAHVRRLRLPVLLATIAALAAASGCGTDPGEGSAEVFRLAATDGSTGSSLRCFASSIQYSGGAVVRSGDCDVALRSLEVRFDSTGPVPALVVTARVLQNGDTATWQARVPATVQNSTIQYDFSTVTEPFTDQEAFVLPWAGTLVDGVLTLRMASSYSSGQPDRTEYFRLHPTVFVLTPTGRLPRVTPLAQHYTAFAFAGLPTDYCSESTPELPSRCFHTSFTLMSTGGSGTVAYEAAVRWQTDTAGALYQSTVGVAVTHSNTYVRVVSPETPPLHVPLAFEAEGSLVGDVLTLFTYTEHFSSPIVARAE
jgi:hypothetical protein